MASKYSSIALVAVLLLALVGHGIFWYAPRARDRQPSPESPVAQLLTDAGYRSAVWIPYPHQNLGFLRQRAGLSGDAFQALARLVDLEVPELPSFGQLAVPPSREIAFAVAEDGRRFALRAHVYPLFAAFARLSGRLADNPWLAGGEIFRDGLQVDVRWEGNVWQVESAGSSPEETTEELPDQDPALIFLRLRRSAPPVPEGHYRLLQNGDALEMVSHPDPEQPRGFEPLDLPQLRIFLFAYANDGSLSEHPQALVFFDQDASRTLELPRVALVHPQDSSRWELPGERLLEISGQSPRTAEVEGWQVAALDRASADAGGELASRLQQLQEGRDRELRWALWLDLRGSLREVSRLAYMLRQVPLIPARELQKWSDIEQVLAAVVSSFSHLTLEVAGTEGESDSLRLRLEPRSVE